MSTVHSKPFMQMDLERSTLDLMERPPTGEDLLPTLEYAEVGEHDHEGSAYVAYEGKVYDITEFLRHHPGGNSILVPALGSDITDAVDSSHGAFVGNLLRSPERREKFGIRLVGKLATEVDQNGCRIGLREYQSRREYLRPDTMGAELRHAVYSFLRAEGLQYQKSVPECVMLLVMFYALYGTALYMAFAQGSALWSILLGPIATFMAVNVAHTSMHGGFSHSKVLNLLARTLWDVGGYSSRCWDVEHHSHHQAPHTMIDLQTSGGTVIRFFEHQEYKWFHRYQMLYIWFVFILYSPNSWIVHTYNTLVRYKCVPRWEKWVHVIAKTCGFVLPIAYSFYHLGFGIAFRDVMLFAVSMSYFSLFSLFIQHEDAYLTEKENEPWSVRQVTTSSSWYTSNKPFQWFLGYFNFHTEHHLFPALNPALYPKIQPIVMSICKKYGVAYKRISFFELVASQTRAWRKYSHGIPAR
jgi:linoleoyl-CoA desaturase